MLKYSHKEQTETPETANSSITRITGSEAAEGQTDCFSPTIRTAREAIPLAHNETQTNACIARIAI